MLEPLEARIAPAQVVATWIGTSDGNWSDAFNWDIGVVPNNNATDTYVVVIDLGTNPVVTVSDPITIDSLQNAEIIEVLNGTLRVNDLASNTGLLSAAGLGRVVLDGAFTTAELGSFESSDGGIISIEGELDNTGSTLFLDGMTGSLYLDGAQILGGTISTVDGAAVFVGPSSSSVRGITLAGDLIVGPDSSLSILDGLTLSGGRLRVESGPGDQFAGVYFNGTQTLGGTGEVLFGGTGINVLQVVGTPSQSGAATLTIGSGVTIHGTRSGQVNSAFGFDTVINQGTILSETAGEIIQINAARFINDTGGVVSSTDGILELTGDWSNPNGTLSVSGAGHLTLGGLFATEDIGTISRSGGVIHINGTLDNTGRTLALDGTTGSFKLTNGSIIMGGTITATGGATLEVVPMNSATLRGVTLATDIYVPERSTVTVLEGLTLDGANVVLAGATEAATINFLGTQTLGGMGGVIFSGSSSANFVTVIGGGNSAAQAATLTIGPDITVTGSQGGTLNGFYSSDRIINQGQIILSGVGQTFVLNVSSFINQGLISIGPSLLSVQGGFTQESGTTVIIGGTLGSAGATLNYQGGVLAGSGTVEGNVSNTGAFVMPGAGFEPGTLTIQGNYTQGANASLQIKIYGVTPGVGYDRFEVTGTATLGGTLSVTRGGGFTYGTGTTFDIINAGSLTGLFSVAEGLGLLSMTATSTGIQLLDMTTVYTWDGSESDDWFTAANWTPEGVPGSHDIAILNLGSMIRLNSIATVGQYSQYAGTLSGAGSLIVNDKVTWAGGMMSGSGVTQVLGELMIDGGLVQLAGRTLVLGQESEAIIGGNGGELRLSGGAVVINQGTFLTTFNSGGITAVPGDIPSVFFNEGTFANFGVVQIAVPFLNMGSIALDADSTLIFRGGFTQFAEGVVAGSSSSTIRLEGSFASVQGMITANVVNDGAIFGPGGLHQAGSLIINGNYQQDSGTLVIDVGGKATGAYDQLTITGTATLNGTLSVNTLGSFVIKNNSTFDVLSFGTAESVLPSLDAPAGISIEPSSNGLSLVAHTPQDSSRTITGRDQDGDIITIKVDKGTIPNDAVKYGPNNEILAIDLRAVDSKLKGSKITISVIQDGGDGNVTIGQIRANGLNLNKLDIRGDVGEIDVGTGKKQAIKVLSVNNLGLLDSSGTTFSDINGSVGKLIIRENLLNAGFYILGKLGKVTIGGNFIGSTTGAANLAQLQNALRGDPRASGGIPVGAVNADSIGSFQVNGNMDSAGVSAEGDIGKVNVKGNVNGGGVAAGGRIKVVKVVGSMMGEDPENPFILAALGQKKGKALSKSTIDQITVNKDVVNARILLGYNKDQQPINPDAKINKILVKGNWVASSLVAGVIDETEDGFGINDTLFPNDTTKKAVATIANIIIKGTATGSATEGEHYAITAQKIGKLSINGEKISLNKKAKDDIPLDDENGNFRLVEL